MIRDVVLLVCAVFFAVAGGYFYLHNDNLQVCAGIIFTGTWLLSWASPKRFPVFALITGSSILLANIYARVNQLAVPAPPAGFAEVFLAFIPAVVAGIGGMIIGGGLNKLPDRLGRGPEAAASAIPASASPGRAAVPASATATSVSAGPGKDQGAAQTGRIPTRPESPAREDRPFA